MNTCRFGGVPVQTYLSVRRVARLGITLALPLCASAAWAQPAGEGTAASVQSPWIDVHVHLVGRGGIAAAPQAVLDLMQRAAIRKLVLMPTPQPTSQPDYEALVPVARSNAQRFAFLGGGGTLNPMIHAHRDASQVTDEVKRQFESKADEIINSGASGFGEIAAFHPSVMPGHPYEFVPPDHPLFLLLADVAARREVVIDLHMDLVVEPTAPRGPLANPTNPPMFEPNLAAFERLLAHNRKAKLVWAHAGSDFVGHWTVARSRELLRNHPNLYMSLRLGGGLPFNRPLDQTSTLRPEWLGLFREFPDRFVIGSDSFHVGAGMGGGGKGPATFFAPGNEQKAQAARSLLSQLPAKLAAKIGHENAVRLYKLKD